MSNHNWLVVMAGGSGTRFWPRSRSNRPKQLLNIVGEKSLLYSTIERFQGYINPENCLVVTTKKLKKSVEADVAPLGGVQVIAEPHGRNTAPCLAMAMEFIRAKDAEAVVTVVPADSWITDTKDYIDIMKLAADSAVKMKKLVTVGITPSRAETGYGYIRCGESLDSDRVFAVERFVEKPVQEVAETMIQDSAYVWNAGIFVWTAETFFTEMQAASGDVLSCFADYRAEVEAGNSGEAALEAAYKKVENISIDYALLEKSKSVAVVPGQFGWNDLGSFASLEEVLPKVEGGVARAKRVMAVDGLANIVDCPDKTVALLGVQDLIVVDTGDVILVASRERAQEVKKFVTRLKEEENYDLL